MFKTGQLDYLSEMHGLETENWDPLAIRTMVEPEFYDFLGMNYCRVSIEVAVQRKPVYYIAKVYSLMFLILVLAMLSLAFNSNDYEQRINVVMALLLAMVAFQFTLQESIPTVNYLTQMDRFVIWHYVFLAVVGIEACAAVVIYQGSSIGTFFNNGTSLEGDPDTARRLDDAFTFVFPIM